MKSIKKIYFYFSTLLFVLALTFSATSVEAHCYSCTSTDPGGCPINNACGMTACDQTEDCWVYGSICGNNCEFD